MTPESVPEFQARLLDPPLQTAELPGIGGRIRMRPEDFTVHEIPAYGPDGRTGAHLLLILRKRCIGTEDAIVELSRQTGIPRPEIGLAGLKDKDAVTEQWITVPFAAGPRLTEFSHPAIQLGPAAPHGNKLRRGHLHGNRFDLVIRDLAVPGEEARARVTAKAARLAELGGLDNLYGNQRLGNDGGNLRRGLELLASGARRGKADFLLSAGQSALFNLYLLERRARGLMRTVLLGDILKKTATGGLFESREPEVDQARLDASELGLTGPMFGSKMRAPSPGTAADALEREILTLAGISPEALKALGSKVEGTRRPLQLSTIDLQVDLASAEGPLPSGLRLRFSLPAGSYATVLLQELQAPVASTAQTSASAPQ
ncbi:MAG: tRNA pseudouridine(13) synthase TruD [Nannocystis sp.]|uniref:tRNA pseudouridine(13) synthase TruD n=1 Tax=Nannocystis sp. TaxID=1962667 RepID=UPI002425E3E4|nr:tRNA pseudouridine(13) synthase TruD [Nannocystis sp.]MBK9752865.1 tRNA pseudouridine(13) synthase TruD [Nannocystis sp.]